MSKDKGFDRGKGGNRHYRNDNSDIAKYAEGLVKVEKAVAHKKLRARAMCTHTKDLFTPNLGYRDEGNGKIVWFCKTCGEEVDLNRLSDEQLKNLVHGINQACDLIKLMSTGSEKDRKITTDIVAEIQLKVNAYLIPLYKTALNNSGKQTSRRQRQGRKAAPNWSE